MKRIRSHLCAAAVLAAGALSAPPAFGEENCGKGRELYMAKCSQCHGDAGDGKGVGADLFRPLPRDFTSGAYKIRSTESGELPTDADLRSVIRKGMPYTGMPGWPKFTDAEIAALACFVKTFNPDFSDSAYMAKPIAIPKPPAFSPESAEKGKEVYRINKCMDCHGSLGRGDGESGPTLKDDWDQAIRPADLTRRWTFRGGAKREDIYRTIVTGLNGTPMPSFANSLSEEERWHLVDYVHSLSPGDKPPYATMVSADSVAGVIDLDSGAALFGNAKAALFPVVGQVVEGERGFFPAVNAVEVRAVFDAENIAIQVSWHDMHPQTSGSNSPVEAAPGAVSDSGGSAAGLTDAVAVQIPYKQAEGAAKPYFLFGDKRNPAEIWFTELGKPEEPRAFVGKGRGNLAPAESGIRSRAAYADGKWSVTFLRPRRPEKGIPIESGGFVPVAFSVWDGFSGESGSRRGVTSWYSLYLKPPSTGSPYVPAAGKAAAILAVQAALIFWVRRAVRKGDRT